MPIRVDPTSTAITLDPGRPGGPAKERAATALAAAVRAGRWELRLIGNALDLAYLACGRIGAVWHFSTSGPLHFAAGTLLASEAGATVTDADGAPWTIASTGLVAATRR